MAGIGAGARRPWQGKRIAASAEILEEKWRRKEGVIGFPIRSPFKGGFGKVHAMARKVTPGFMYQHTSFP
jgi:hypothetical protein